MNHSPAAILKTHLAALEQEGSTWLFKVSSEPSTPDALITLYDTTPETDAKLQRSGRVNTRWGVQVRVRCKGYETGWAKVNSIAAALDAICRTPVSIGSPAVVYNVHVAKRASGPLHLGTDEGGRALFTVNYLVTIPPS